MSDHVTEWLNAYFDGELSNGRLRQVEKHLAECETCRMELELLHRLSGLLQEAPEPEVPSPERFAAQVNLLLPQKRTAPPQHSLFEIGWWMIPVGLIAAWVFIGTASLLSDMVGTAKHAGLLNNTVASFISSSPGTPDLTSTLGAFGVLQGNSLRFAEMTESFTRDWFPQIVLQASVAVLYLAWIAVWWARHTRQGREMLLER